MTPREAAEALGLSPRTVLGWIKTGRCPAQLDSTADGPRYSVRLTDVRAVAEAPTVIHPAVAVDEAVPASDETPTGVFSFSVAPVPVASVAEVEDLRLEVHDLRAQLHQVEVRLREAIEAAAVRGPANRELRDLILALEKRLELTIRDAGPKRR